MEFSKIENDDVIFFEYYVVTNTLRIDNILFKLLDVNESFDQITIETYQKYVHRNDLEYYNEKVKKALSVGSSYDIEYRLVSPKGHTIYVREIAKVIEYDHDKPIVIVGFIQDITQFKESQIRLRLYEEAIHSSPSSVVITDDKGSIVFVNEMFTKITGYSYEEAIGQNPRILNSGYHDKAYFNNFWSTLLSGKVFTGEIKNKKKDGTLFWESTRIAPVFNEDHEITHYVAIKDDITKQKELQENLLTQKNVLENLVSEKNKEIYNSQVSMSIALAKLSESRDSNTGEHIERVQALCHYLTFELSRVYPFSEVIDKKFLDTIYYASILHDIGKVGIPDEILHKPGKLTKDEFEIMKRHTVIGANTLEEMAIFNSENDIIKMGIEIAKYHHERYDGSGYNEGLKGDEIPLSARIMAIVDVYDALRSVRPYKRAFSHDETVYIITKESEGHFDPRILNLFSQIHMNFELIYDSSINKK